jgi:hypothetical protein
MGGVEKEGKEGRVLVEGRRYNVNNRYIILRLAVAILS